MGNEDVDDIIPHVAAVAAAYGDPSGKYKSFLQSKSSGYKSEAWYFFDQTTALPHSPAAGGKGKRSGSEEGALEARELAPIEQRDVDTDDTTPFSNIPFTCPEVFDTSPKVELEDGLFVTCNELKPLYEIAADPAIIGDEYGL